MNHWAAMLADAPTRLQILIARRQRISVPRGADAPLRVQRLRQSLCHAATVRAVYASLEAPLQTALQDLCQRQRGLSSAELEQSYGPVRSWRALTLDPRPQTISEHLILLGWLLPRPASTNHPLRWLLPPELRHWLPQALQLQSQDSAPSAPLLPPALLASQALILAAAQRPLFVHTRGLRTAEHRHLSVLVHYSIREQPELLDFLLPLLCDLGLLVNHHGRARPGPAADSFLALPPEQQLERLQHSWLAAPRPDSVLLERGMRMDGIDWMVLRRRLCAWVAAIPANQLFDPATLYPALSASFGPLADAHTHGFRSIDRVPWQPARAEALFLRALHGPLHWLGYVSWQSQGSGVGGQGSVFRPGMRTIQEPQPWQYAGDDADVKVLVPAGQSVGLLKLLPFATIDGQQAGYHCYRLNSSSIAQAQTQGYSIDLLQTALEKHAGSLPPDWDSGLCPPKKGLRLADGVAIVADQPALMSRVCQDRTLRRLLDQRLAPGIALLAPEELPRLERQLARQGMSLAMPATPIMPLDTSSPPADLTPGDAATLLVACAYYRSHGADKATLMISPRLETTLANALTPALRAATREAIATLCPGPQSEPLALPEPPERSALPEMVQTLRRSIQRQQTLTIAYDSGGLGRWEQRTIRPLSLELRDDTWYLRAFCHTRQAERTFRLDRMTVENRE